MKVIDHVRGTCRFVRYRDRSFIYQTNDTGFEFSVPLADVEEGVSLNSEERSSCLMRWIRKQVDVLGREQISELQEA